MMSQIHYFQEMWQFALQGKDQGIWFWATFYCFAVCSYSVVFQIRTLFWPSTPGERLDLEISQFGGPDASKSDQDYVSTALYRYKVSGEVYEGSRVSPWVFVASHNAKFILEKQISAIQHYPDGTVKVFYNPSNPQKSFLIIASKMGICITLTIGILPIILFYFKYHA